MNRLITQVRLKQTTRLAENWIVIFKQEVLIWIFLGIQTYECHRPNYTDCQCNSTISRFLSQDAYALSRERCLWRRCSKSNEATIWFKRTNHHILEPSSPATTDVFPRLLLSFSIVLRLFSKCDSTHTHQPFLPTAVEIVELDLHYIGFGYIRTRKPLLEIIETRPCVQ